MLKLQSRSVFLLFSFLLFLSLLFLVFKNKDWGKLEPVTVPIVSVLFLVEDGVDKQCTVFSDWTEKEEASLEQSVKIVVPDACRQVKSEEQISRYQAVGIILRDDFAKETIEYVSKNEIKVTIPNQNVVILSVERLEEQLKSLQALLHSPTIELEQKVIDMRFASVVIR